MSCLRVGSALIQINRWLPLQQCKINKCYVEMVFAYCASEHNAYLTYHVDHANRRDHFPTGSLVSGTVFALVVVHPSVMQLKCKRIQANCLITETIYETSH